MLLKQWGRFAAPSIVVVLVALIGVVGSLTRAGAQDAGTPAP